MTNGPHHLANGRVCPSQAAAAAGGDFVTGRRRIAHEIGKSERQVTRLVSSGILPATRATQVPNAPLSVRSTDLGKVR